jgi:hypothetical protein
LPQLPVKKLLKPQELQEQLEEYINLIVSNQGFCNLLIVKNFLAVDLIKVDPSSEISSPLSPQEEFMQHDTVGNFSRGTLINPVNFKQMHSNNIDDLEE